jgi:DNA-directed RNA polymerase specialized sigma24 family protein
MDSSSAEKNKISDEVASIDEVQLALRALTADNLKKLALAARYWVHRYRLDRVGISHEELLNEAITRTLDGIRNWKPKNVDFVKFLDEVMHSIANHEYEELDRRRSIDSPAAEIQSKLAVLHIADPEIDIEAIEAAFADDPQVLEFLWHKADGKTIPETAEEMGVDSKQIEAIKKRTQRRITRFLGGVGKNEKQKP